MKRKDYTGLRSLRGIGAILIFYHHFGFDGAVIMSFGDFAVSLFFMLSGLVLAASFRPEASHTRITVMGQFMKKRLMKIYPVYQLSLLAAIALRGCSMRALPFDLLMLQSWIPIREFYFSGNSVSWFVSSLFFSYLLFCPMMVAITADSKRFLRFFFVGLFLYIIIVVNVPSDFQTGIIYISPVMQLPAFILGILVWKTFERYPADNVSKSRISAVQIGSVGIIVGMIFLYRYVDPRWSLASYWWIPDFALLYILLVSERYATLINRFMRLKVMQITGDISFVFYLFHTIVIELYRCFLNYTGIELPMFMSSLICLAATLVISYFLHYRVELPIASRLRELGR